MPRRRNAILFAFLILGPAALAQPGGEKGAPRNPTSPRTDAQSAQPPTLGTTRHAATGLVIPARLAGASLSRITDYSRPPANDARLGTSYHYIAPGPVFVSLYIYDAGIRPGPPDGAMNLIVLRQFDLAVRDIRTAAQQGRYRDLKSITGPQQCGTDLLVFQCTAFTARTQQDMDIHTALMLGGWREHFIKLRVDWPNRPDMPNAAEAALNDLTRAQSR